MSGLRRSRAARGQSLVLAVLLMLVVVVTAFLTFSIGARTRRKIQLQAVADSTAYSLAVAEARAFNFYAWSNRALVAHHVSILSVHAHQSYFSFYEDMLAATGDNFDKMAEPYRRPCRGGNRRACETQQRLERIRDIYLYSYFDPADEFSVPWYCTYVNGMESCRVDADCQSGETCEDMSVHRKRGAIWFHKEWHKKDSSNSCFHLLEGSRNHFKKVEYVRSRQLMVEAQLKMMMTGQEQDAWLVDPNDEDELLKVNTGMNEDPRDGFMYQRPRPQASLAEAMARLTGPEYEALPSAGRVSRDYYKRAVDNGMELRRHRDYDEVLAATRFPNFITQRDRTSDDLELPADPNWVQLSRAARRAGRNHGTPYTEVTTAGTARMVKIASQAEDPGSRNLSNPGVNPAWPGNYNSNVRPWGGRTLADAAHGGRHADAYGPGESDGAVAEDHGVVRSTYTLNRGGRLTHTTVLRPGRNGIWADPHDYDADRTGAPAHSHHLFHGDLMRVNGHGQGLGSCEGPGCDQEMNRGLYRGHMRYRLARENTLWNMPRTLTLITRPSGETQRMPWDFDFQAQLPGPVRFTTLNSAGDVASDGRMAAMAGGLVYFHKPRLQARGREDEEYAEPPNLWNPFWRAKLHPLMHADAITATAGGAHDATHHVLTDLYRWNAVNY
ncbi:hypothetical protein [Pyxidicoccus trucidator]|uniref:hypothetical protein n=1 Tax=Pyxidicoccus trucidator TaxID=2709662 RepID=UPI0013DAA10A|nr:hypothetical protein [Pyxidicoccus trucidator]